MQKSTRTKMQFMHQNYVFYKLDTEIFPDIGNTGKSFSCLYPCLAVFFCPAAIPSLSMASHLFTMAYNTLLLKQPAVPKYYNFFPDERR